ncbi:helix-loop-helix DNA-binding domain-containing protein [Diplocarpon rosae]|nr:helix-loop-helix DNA-binding domain-containing protein [Diplocarpon rosae]
MPSRNFGFQGSDNGVVVAPRSLVNTNPNLLDKAFHEGLYLEEWDSWMAWGGATPERLPTSVERRESTASTISSPEGPCALGLGASMVENMEASYAAVTGLPFEDVPFELDETPLTPVSSTGSPSAPTYPVTACYSTQSQGHPDLRRPYGAFPSLAAAEERRLDDVTMPHHALSHIEIASTTASSMDTESVSPAPSPDVRPRQNKRKSVDLGEQPSTLCQSRKRGHNAIEKRYRTNLNAKIECLRRGVPSLCVSDKISGAGSDGAAVDDSKPGKQKYGKAAILTRALEYIRHLESTTQRLGGEVDSLKTRVGAFEKLARSGGIILSGSALGMLSRSVSTTTETLESIQSDFQQMKPKVAKSAVKPPARRRGTRQTKAAGEVSLENKGRGKQSAKGVLSASSMKGGQFSAHVDGQTLLLI